MEFIFSQIFKIRKLNFGEYLANLKILKIRMALEYAIANIAPYDNLSIGVK